MATPKIWKSAFQVNATDGGFSQQLPIIIPVAGGGLLAIWEDDSAFYNTGGTALVGHRFDGAGAPIGGEAELSPAEALDYGLGDVVRTSAGNILIGLTVETEPGNRDILVRVLDAGLGNVRLDNIETSASDGSAPAIAPLAGGGYAIAYENDSGSERDIIMRIVDGNGTVGAAIPISDDTINSERVAMATLSNGAIALTWQKQFSATDHDVHYAVYAPTGVAVKEAVFVPGGGGQENETTPSIAALAGGGFVVVWTDTDIDEASNETKGIQAAIFDNDGTPLDDGNGSPLEILVNTSIAGDQEHAAVAALADGGFIVAWSDADAGLVRGQRFTAAGAADGTEFTIAIGASAGPIELTALPDGRVAAAFAQGTSDIDSFVVLIDPRVGPILGTDNADVLFSTADGTTVSGLDGIDTLYGADGADILDGGLGNDAMAGGLGNDVYVVDSAQDAVIEGAAAGSDTVRSGAISLKLASYANIENLELTGALGLNLTGNAGANRLSGNAGSNLITGGLARDTLSGGAARDIFDFNTIAETGKAAATRDLILDFQRGLDDIDLRTIDAKSGTSANDAFLFIGTQAFHKVKGELRVLQQDFAGTANDRTVVEGDVTGDGRADFQIELKGLIGLTKGDFLL